MKKRDGLKKEAIAKATIKLVNEVGLISCSVDEIAKGAGISKGTIYLYYKNKKDLLVSVFIELNQTFSDALLKNLDAEGAVQKSLKQIWKNGFEFIADNKPTYKYLEQFTSSPYLNLADQQILENLYEPIIRILKHGIAQKIIKDVPTDILLTFFFYPIMILSNPTLCKHLELTDNNIDKSFSLAWDAVKIIK